MHAVASLNIPSFYSAYRVLMNSGENDGTTGERSPDYVRETWYSCEKCKSRFVVYHKWNSGLYYGGGHFDDSIVYCPYCGNRHESFLNRDNVYNFKNQSEPDSMEAAPRSMFILFMEYKQGFIMRVVSKAITLRKPREDAHEIIRHFSKRVEEIRFDLKARQTTFSILTGSHRVAMKKYEIGNPFDCDLYEDSLLRHVRSDNLSEHNREGIVAFMKTVRDSLRRKWKQIHGYDVGSIFTSYGQTHGKMLFPIMNFAFRFRYPDAPNLPRDLNGSKTDVEMFKSMTMIAEADETRYLQVAQDKTTDSITSVIRVFGLPDKPMVRKLLSEQFFAAPELVALFKVTTNLDCAVQLWNRLREMARDNQSHMWSFCNRRHLSDMYPLLQQFSQHYQIRSIMALLKRSTWDHVMDIGSMIRRLVDNRHADMWKVKLKKLHDWLVQALQEQREKGFELNPSDAIKRRLAMQMDSLKFFLPEHTKELVKASETLQNCVRTYGERVKEGVCNIVLMTDDRGKLVACLEVREGVLHQAKLKFNKEVSKDAKINAAVIDWCKKANIKIGTSDVQQNVNIQFNMVNTEQPTERVA